MATKQFALEAGGPPRLEFEWGMFWRNFTVSLDGKVVDTVEGGASALKKGVKVTLPDRTVLEVQLQSGVLSAELAVKRNGLPLPGSSTDPEQQIKTAAYMLYFLAGLNTLLGVVAMVLGSEEMDALGLGIGSIVFGALVAVFGFFTYRATRFGPILAILLYIGDTVVTLMDSIDAGGRPNVVGLIIRVYIIVTLVKAAQAAGELKRREQENAGVSLQP
ncbi:hypothetical protein [Myxococcus fulvus]|uniref:hypothetical protein n=1 Tax=Myxococcus TaxID=32 RepID=UPI0020BF2254|nr:hypothetical protein [Myxococcus fulvus]MCK8498579.1 hypothetical protein [Myxococcus fulvus]